jgi:hypothetical protein
MSATRYLHSAIWALTEENIRRLYEIAIENYFCDRLINDH